MRQDTGEVRPYDEIPDPENWSEPFSRGDEVQIKGLTFTIVNWTTNRILLELKKK